MENIYYNDEIDIIATKNRQLHTSTITTNHRTTKYKQFHSFWLWKRDIITRNDYNTLLENWKIYTKKMKSNKSLKDYRTSLTPQYNGAIMKKWYKLGRQIWKPNMCLYPWQRPHSQPPRPRAQPLNTCSHITTQHQSHNRPYRILNIDASVEFAQQHASCVDMTIRACPHKNRPSILPTYNINTSDHIHTQYTTMLSTIIELLHRPGPI